MAREVAAAKPALNALVAPIEMPDQITVTLVTARFLEGSGFWPDVTEYANPFAGAPEALQQEAARIQPHFVEALRQLATRIASAGAPLDATDPGALLVLAQLTLLDADLTHPTAEVVDDLNVWPPGSIDREAAMQGHLATHTTRHGRTARFQADLAAGAEFVAGHLGPPSIRPPYSGGRQRATRSDTLALRKALAVLVGQYPSLTPGSLLAAVGGEDHPALQQLRIALGVEEGWLPEQRRIERHWPKSRH